MTTNEEPEKDSILGEVTRLMYDTSAALEDIVNQEKIILDYAHAAHAMMDLLKQLRNIHDRLLKARLNGTEIQSIYGAVMPGHYGEKETTLCHCGKPEYTEVDGYTRHMCQECSTIRCDAPEEGITYPCYRTER
jgi:hypothetical protein